MRRTMSALALCVLLPFVVVLASCGRSDDRVELEFWTISLKPVFTEYIEERIAAFEHRHPETRVEWVDIPFGAIERKFIAASAAGRGPDVINLSDLMFARFAAVGAFESIDAVLPVDVAATYHEGAAGIGRLGGGLQAVPWYLTTQATIYNEPMLRAGGLTPETLGRTWRELAGQAMAFREASGAYLFTQPLGQDSQLLIMLLGEGLPPFRAGEDGRLSADLTRPDVLEYLAVWVELYRAGGLPREAATQGFEHLIDVYQNERVAALNTGANFLRRVRGVSQRVYDQTGILPPVTGRLGRPHIAVMPLSVTAASEHPELAAALAAHMTSAESQLAFCKLATILPSTPAAFKDPFFAGPTEAERDEGMAMVGEARAIVASALTEAVAFTPALECWPDLRRAFEAGMKRVLLEGADLAGTMAEVEAEWDRRIAGMNSRRAMAGGSPATMDAIPTPSPVNGGSR